MRRCERVPRTIIYILRRVYINTLSSKTYEHASSSPNYYPNTAKEIKHLQDSLVEESFV